MIADVLKTTVAVIVLLGPDGGAAAAYGEEIAGDGASAAGGVVAPAAAADNAVAAEPLLRGTSAVSDVAESGLGRLMMREALPRRPRVPSGTWCLSSETTVHGVRLMSGYQVLQCRPDSSRL